MRFDCFLILFQSSLIGFGGILADMPEIPFFCVSEDFGLVRQAHLGARIVAMSHGAPNAVGPAPRPVARGRAKYSMDCIAWLGVGPCMAIAWVW